MDKNKILKEYIQYISEQTDSLREHYPKAMSPEIIQMEKGYRFCTTKSVKWIEKILDTINIVEDTPMSAATSRAIEHTNSLSQVNPIKKKSFLQVASEAAKDMASDVFKANQMDLSKEKK